MSYSPTRLCHLWITSRCSPNFKAGAGELPQVCGKISWNSSSTTSKAVCRRSGAQQDFESNERRRNSTSAVIGSGKSILKVFYSSYAFYSIQLVKFDLFCRINHRRHRRPSHHNQSTVALVKARIIKKFRSPRRRAQRIKKRNGLLESKKKSDEKALKSARWQLRRIRKRRVARRKSSK